MPRAVASSGGSAPEPHGLQRVEPLPAPPSSSTKALRLASHSGARPARFAVAAGNPHAAGLHAARGTTPPTRDPCTFGLTALTAVPIARESGRPIHMQTATPGGAGRNDFSPRITEHRCHEEATAHHWTRPRGVAPRALRRHFRDRLMLPLAVAFPVALLPIMVLLVTLRLMVLSTRTA